MTTGCTLTDKQVAIAALSMSQVLRDARLSFFATREEIIDAMLALVGYKTEQEAHDEHA